MITSEQLAALRKNGLKQEGQVVHCPLCLSLTEGSRNGWVSCRICGWELTLTQALGLIRKMDPAAAEAQMRSDQ